MNDNEITAIVGWPTEPEMAKFRKVAAAAEAAERERCAGLCESTYPEWNTDDSAFQKPCFDTPAECAVAIRRVRPNVLAKRPDTATQEKR